MPQTILLVDDQSMVRDVVALMLRICGYTVLEASGGVAALRLIEDHQEQIHLLLTDVRMPEMNGVELGDRVAALYPAIRILYMSADASDLLDRLGRQAGPSFIQKPFAGDQLAQKVRDILAGQP